MGLLDNINLDDPKTMGLLNLGLGILSGNTGRPGDLGQGVMGGFQNYQNMMAQQERKKLMEQQQQMQSTQFDWLKADREKADAQAAARQQALGGVSQQFGIDPNVVAAFPSIGEDLVKNKLIPKAPKIGFAPNGMAYDENNPQLQVGQVYAKPETDSTPSAVKEYQFAKEQGFPGSFMDFQLSQKRAGASTNNVSVNTGQKGFDNTLKLRTDFRSEPIYKAHQDVKSAHSQISTALKQNSPAGDLAGATKIMKILDPGSVVRESELGMAMAASGALDRLTNYSDMVIRGTKLTPTQRKDFQTLADALYKESSNQYNTKRQEYQGIAERNGLDTMDVLGPEDKSVPKPRNAASVPMPEKPSPMTLKKGTVYQTPKGELRWNGKAFEDF